MFYHGVMPQKDADRKANSEDPDQIREEQFDLGLHCLPRPVCLKFRIIMVHKFRQTIENSELK